MGYSESLEAAGAKVLHYEEFGSYQGDWAAIVEYDGQKGVAFGSFGSCTGCDAFQGEFGYSNEARERDGKYYKDYWSDEEITKDEYDQIMIDHQKKLAEFGRDYLTNISDRAIIETRLTNLDAEDYFDSETKEMLTWCLAHLNESE